MGITAKFGRDELYDSIRAGDIGLVRLPLGEIEPVAGVIESRM